MEQSAVSVEVCGGRIVRGPEGTRAGDMRGGAARGHVGKVIRGQGLQIRARRLRGSVDQRTHLQVSGLSQSGIRYRLSGSGAGAGNKVQRCKCGVAACKSAKVRDIQKVPHLHLVPNTRTRDLMAETRDLRMASCSQPLSSTQSSAIDSAIFSSIQPSTQSSIQSSIFHPFPPSSIVHLVATPCAS